MNIPHFPEANHPLIKSLFHYSDRELLTLFQRYREQGKFFTAIFCRYSPIVHTLIWHSARSPVQADYLAALTWRHIFYEMGELNLQGTQNTDENSFQNWLINITAVCINQIEVPTVESIHYDIREASPPLWCYLELALNQLPPRTRLMLVMAKTFHWSETRISAYLQAEKEMLSPADVQAELQQGYRMLETALPKDIQEIYLDREGDDQVKLEDESLMALGELGVRG